MVGLCIVSELKVIRGKTFIYLLVYLFQWLYRFLIFQLNKPFMAGDPSLGPLPWGKLRSLAIVRVHSEAYDQTGRMPRMIWIFAGRKGHFVGFIMGRLILFWLTLTFTFLAHLSWRLTRWAYRMGPEPAFVRPSTLSNMNISETSRPITTKFYLKHHWGGGKAALGFGADQIRTLVSIATDISHRVIMGKRESSRFLDCFWSDPFYICR